MKVLYIEDKPINIHIMNKIVKAADCELTVAATAKEGLALLVEQPDLIMTDIGLPDMAGSDLILQIRTLLPEVPIIAVTAHVLPGDREECMAVGCTEYISKPFKFADMVTLLNRYSAVLRGKY